MNRNDMAWVMVRVAGLSILGLGLQTMPSLVLAVPEIIHIAQSWEMLQDSNTLQHLLAHGPVAHTTGIICKLVIYLITGLYLLGRGEGLIALICRKTD